MTMMRRQVLSLALVALCSHRVEAFTSNTHVETSRHAKFSSKSQTTRTVGKSPSSSRASSSTLLQISLEDSWSSVAEVVGDIYNTDLGETVDWNSLLAPEAWAIDQVQATVIKLWVLYSSLPLWQEVGTALVPVLFVAFATLWSLAHPPNDYRDGYEPYARGAYDAIAAKAYYSEHPKIVVQRTLQLLRLCNNFIFNILVDKYIRRDEESTRQERANELLGLIQRIGPTAIKVGQALSVRPDLIPLEYADTLATLQDQVPPFSSGEAREILFQDLGERRMSSIQNLNFQQGPVASASIGQVYRCFANDLEVAIKVQRPNVLAEIALDLHIVREFAPYYRKLTGAATDLQGLADEWGRGFIAELDYHTEAANTKKFNVEMEKRKLTTVAAPVVVDDYSTDRVLTTQWVDGCRLDESNANDVPRLCSVALNAYLVMLLELQSLHCDPHPGNLLRSKEGKLVILDWGMTLDTDPDLQYSLLEFVAHLTSSDYDKVPEDLVKLGFLKEDRLESVKSSGFLEPLVYFLQQAKQGGGGEKVRERIFTEFREKYPGMDDDELRIQMRSDMKQQMEEVRKRESAVTGITIEVEELQKRNRDAFRIPPWFLYTSRAFLTLEGVSLQADENFSIIQSCFPYVAKRLVGDDSPRAQKALRDLLYGAGDYLDVERVSDLANGFSRYTTTTKSVNHEIKERNIGVELVVKEPGVENRVDSQYGNRDAKIAQAEAALLLAKDSADILLAADGNLVQDILIDETALATSANVKDALRTALVDRPKQIRESLPLIGSILPPSPFEIGVAPFLKKTKQEENAQELIGKISTSFPRPSAPFLPGVSTTDAVPFATESSNTRFDSRIDPEQAAMVAKAIRENLPKYAPLVGQLGGKFASILLKTASNNIDTTLEEMDHNNDEQDQLVKAAARSLSTAATRGADAISRRVQQEDR